MLECISKMIYLAMIMLLAATAFGQTGKYFAITVVDEETDRGVPLVELTTTNHLRYYTDSMGIVAFYEPGLMGQDVYFHIKSHGYEYPKDQFNYSGLALKPIEGGSAEIRIKRINIAERLYRVTGEGIYADSVLLGRKAPIKQPLLNGLVVGQDSILTEVYKGKVFWIWGDTTKVAYPLGNFQVTGATSQLPGKSGLDPEVGVDLTYFVREDGFTKEMAPIPGPGPCWLSALMTLVDDAKQERLFASYAKVDNTMRAHDIGLVEYNDDKELFEPVAKFDLEAPIKPGGHPFRVVDKGIAYIHFSPITRVRADIAHLKDQSSYEAFTCLKPGSRTDKIETERFAWKRDTPALLPQDEARLIKEGSLKPEDALFRIQDCDTGKPVLMHGSSVSWNPYRKRWVMIMSEIYGTSLLGETWYVEADTPLGPWVYALKIVTHVNYSFYNPRHHPMFDKEGGRVIFFEGTYTNFFTGNPDFTPRYDYNQVMYKLDLSSPRLALPVPWYALAPDKFVIGAGATGSPEIAFFASDLPGLNTVAVMLGKTKIYALPADAPNPPPTTTPLYEFVNGKKKAYTTDASWSKEGFRRSERPICLVWKNPMTVTLPLSRYAPRL